MRYKSSFFGPFIIALLSIHWNVLLFLVFDSPKSEDAIEFITANTSGFSFFMAVACAVAYLVFFPWLEFAIEWLASWGKRKRNKFQFTEKTAETRMRREVAQEQDRVLELRFKNIANQAKLTDIDLVKKYQMSLSGENFNRWLSDLERGPLNQNLNNNIVDFLGKYDSVEGQFLDERIRALHQDFVGKLSTLHSALNENSRDPDHVKKALIVQFAKEAKDAHTLYRDKAREILNV
jgi:hypothetical protein